MKSLLREKQKRQDITDQQIDSILQWTATSGLLEDLIHPWAKVRKQAYYQIMIGNPEVFCDKKPQWKKDFFSILSEKQIEGNLVKMAIAKVKRNQGTVDRANQIVADNERKRLEEEAQRLRDQIEKEELSRLRKEVEYLKSLLKANSIVAKVNELNPENQLASFKNSISVQAIEKINGSASSKVSTKPPSPISKQPVQLDENAPKPLQGIPPKDHVLDDF